MKPGLLLALVLLSLSGLATEPSPVLPKVQVSPDRTGFETNGAPVVLMGVNYFRPGTGWAPQVWKQFDPEATRRDFARLKAIGGNCVRVFLTYGSFMAEPGVVSEAALAKLDRFLDLAEEAGIYVHPTGPDHWEGLPAWAQTDRLADETVLQALERFWATVAARYRGRNTLFAWDLLNEPMVGWDTPAMRAKWQDWLRDRYKALPALAKAWSVPEDLLEFGSIPVPPKNEPPGPRLLDYQHFRESIAVEWTRRQAAAIKSADPTALVTIGLIQWSVPAHPGPPSQYAAFRPAQLAPMLDFMEVHFYPLARGFYEYGGDEDEGRNLAYLESVVREVAACAKPVLLAEFGWYGGGKLTLDGGRHPAATEAQQARWCRRVIETTEGYCRGWLNWGMYDHPQAGDVTQLLGLFTVDGRTKEWGRTFAELARRGRAEGLSGPPQWERPPLDWDGCIQDRAAIEAWQEAYFQAWTTAH
ncbi:MAG: beta-galactosidase [Verrucomicrobiales bacterium]|nr:beta-galactosidase [Verrucomicrobiales bacterium]